LWKRVCGGRVPDEAAQKKNERRRRQTQIAGTNGIVRCSMGAEAEDLQAERKVAGSLPSAMLLAATGGSLDAFIYLNHGHVFAAAMTGNGVLLGVSILHHDWMQAVRHVLPILGFVLGAFFARVLDGRFRRHAVTVGLVLEMLALLGASFLPGSFPDVAFVPLIAVVAAYQVASFRKADEYSYNSTFMTGNLRTAVDGLYEAGRRRSGSAETRRAGWRKFHSLSLVVIAFLAGAAVGAILAPRMLNHTLWVIDLPLVAVVVMALRRSRLEV
jgi:uncharacterized membrane protein YoaK (UPF0700 family)